MKICHSGLALLFCGLLCFTSCASLKNTHSEISPVFITNTKRFYLLAPESISSNVDKTQLLNGRFGQNEFSLLTYTQADSNGIFMSLFNDFGVSMGSLNYDGVSVQFDSNVFPKQLKAEYIIADLQFAYYSADSIKKALNDLGLEFTETVTDEKTERKILSSSKEIEVITIEKNQTSIKNLLRDYEYNLLEAAE